MQYGARIGVEAEEDEGLGVDAQGTKVCCIPTCVSVQGCRLSEVLYIGLLSDGYHSRSSKKVHL